jgi:hypothetical protein
MIRLYTVIKPKWKYIHKVVVREKIVISFKDDFYKKSQQSLTLFYCLFQQINFIF